MVGSVIDIEMRKTEAEKTRFNAWNMKRRPNAKRTKAIDKVLCFALSHTIFFKWILCKKKKDIDELHAHGVWNVFCLIWGIVYRRIYFRGNLDSFCHSICPNESVHGDGFPCNLMQSPTAVSQGIIITCSWPRKYCWKRIGFSRIWGSCSSHSNLHIAV